MESLQNNLKHTGDSQIDFLAPPNLKPPLSVCLQRYKCDKKVHRGALLRGFASRCRFIAWERLSAATFSWLRRIPQHE